jgi:ribonuclease HI
METQRAGVRIFTDGAASPNPGPGGYGVVILKDDTRSELSGGYRKTTNNRMELRAVIEGLLAIKDKEPAVTVYSDSRYVVDMFNGGYAQQWKARRWMRNARDKAENPDLWEQLLDLCGRTPVAFEWVKGHSSHPENERCDQLAVEARQGTDLPPDAPYETAVESKPRQTMFDWMQTK